MKLRTQKEVVACADFLENLDCEISVAWRGEKRPSLITAEGDEMKVAATDDALQTLGHRGEEGPTLCKRRKE